MSTEFRSFAEIFRDAQREAETPPISPLITEPATSLPEPQADDDRLFAARLCERVELVLERLLENLACEVLGRELLLAPAEIDAIVRRLLQTYGIARAQVTASGDELTIACDAGTIDASLGRRLRAAISRARQ